MNKKKLGLMLASTALIASAVLFGTLAYFTDSESVANTFTVGNVNITLDEAKVNDYGQPTKDDVKVDGYIDADGEIVENAPEVDRVNDTNNYKLVPGRTYVKDPTVTVEAGSEPAYVRMKVMVSHIGVLDEIFDAVKKGTGKEIKLLDIFNGYDEKTWIFAGESRTTSPGSIEYEFRYYDKDNNTAIVDASEKTVDVELEPLFDSFTVPGYFGSEQMQDLDGMTITVIGEAIQSDTFADENAAWDAFEMQMAVDKNYNSAATTTP